MRNTLVNIQATLSTFGHDGGKKQMKNPLKWNFV